MKKIVSYLLIGICCLGLTGCGSFPDLTAAQQELIAEYAAGILLKYSKTSNNRLTEVDEEAVLEKIEEENQEEVVDDEVEDTEQVVEDNAPVTDATQEIQIEEVIVSQPMNQVLGLSDVTLQSNGYEIKDSYPEEEGMYFALDASDGYKLIVLKFSLFNSTENSIDVNMLGTSSRFKVSLNGSGYKAALSTMLLDDMSTYVGTIGAGESVDLVLISEWTEEEISNISNLTLYIQNGELSGTYTIE